MHFVVAFCVHENNHFAAQNAECYQPFLSVICPDILTSDREVVPDGVGPLEIQAVKLDVASPLGFVPSGHVHIVVTIRSDSKFKI